MRYSAYLLYAVRALSLVIAAALLVLGSTNDGLGQSGCFDDCKRGIAGKRIDVTEAANVAACRDRCRGNSKCNAWMYWHAGVIHPRLCELIGLDYTMIASPTSTNVTSGIVRLSPREVDANAPGVWTARMHATFTSYEIEETNDSIIIKVAGVKRMFDKRARAFVQTFAVKKQISVRDGFDLLGGFLSESQWTLVVKNMAATGFIYISPGP